MATMTEWQDTTDEYNQPAYLRTLEVDANTTFRAYVVHSHDGWTHQIIWDDGFSALDTDPTHYPIGTTLPAAKERATKRLKNIQFLFDGEIL